jgi:hypothetical protein
MSTTDLDAVAIRRTEIAHALSGYEANRAKLEAELDELALTERVLVRLSDLMPARPAPAEPSYAPQYVTAEPLHTRAIGMLKSWIPGRGE